MSKQQFFWLMVLSTQSIILFGQRELTVTEINSDNAAVIELNGESSTQSDFTQMILGFNQSSAGWLRTVTNHDLSFWTNNSRRLTVKNNGRVGIGTSIPSETLDVQGNTNIDGNLTQRGSGNTTIESTSGAITISTTSAVIEILPNGDINILSSGNIGMTADGNLSLTAGGDIDITSNKELSISAADGIIMTSGSDLLMNASSTFSLNAANNVFSASSNTSIISGFNLTSTVGSDYDLTVGDDTTLAIGGDFTSTVADSYNITASNSTQNYSATFTLTSVDMTSLHSDSIRLNADSNSKGAARIDDTIKNSSILTGSVALCY